MGGARDADRDSAASSGVIESAWQKGGGEMGESGNFARSIAGSIATTGANVRAREPDFPENAGRNKE
jgi:hypothetical protein